MLRYARFLITTANLSNQMAMKAITALWNSPAPISLTRPFSDAVAQYLVIHYFLEHGQLTAAKAAQDPGSTVCPSCTPVNRTFCGPLFLVC